MTSTFEVRPLSPEEIEDYGQARVRDIAFDAVQSLWRRRRDEGMRQTDLAAALGRDPGWVSKKLNGPGNWTFKTFGALIEALNGEVEISAFGKEDACEVSTNYHAYDDFSAGTGRPRLQVTVSPASISIKERELVRVGTGQK